VTVVVVCAMTVSFHSFEEILGQACTRFFLSCKVPRGIAMTSGLTENMFATAVCFQACLGVLITGPPGLGKTLAVQIVTANMKGISSPRDEFHELMSLQKFPYQCSASSTAQEIEQVYMAADARRKQLLKSGILSERCVVVLDEATLPKQQYAALKGAWRDQAGCG
jgi:hypothetical protein